MSLGLIGKKIGMTQIFGSDGELIPVTVLKVGPCVVVQKKQREKDGYNALKIGFEETKATRVAKAQAKDFEKRKLPLCKWLREFRTDAALPFQVGDKLKATGFEVGDFVDVQGITKGRGFQGVMKKEGKHGGPDAHGSDFHRRPGSIGMRTWPGRVIKNMGMPGRMGQDRVTVRNLEVVGVRGEEDVLMVRGSIPGARNCLVTLKCRAKDFETRERLKG